MFENTQKPRQNPSSQSYPQDTGMSSQQLPRPGIQQSSVRSAAEDIFAETSDMTPQSPQFVSQPDLSSRGQGAESLSPGPTSQPMATAPAGAGVTGTSAGSSGLTPPGTPQNPFVPVQPGNIPSSSLPLGSRALSRSQKIILVLVGIFVVGILLAGGFFLYIYIQKRAQPDVPIDAMGLNVNALRNQALQNANESSAGNANVNTNRAVGTVNTNIPVINLNQNTNRSTQNANQNVNANELVNACLNTNTTSNANAAGNTNAVTNTSRNSNTNTTPSATSDLDADGLLYEAEMKYGTDPNNADSDKDGYLDGEEVENGYDPLGPGKLKTTK
ncbi:MAG: hypothetical protein A3G01_00995 [Candidatus Kerfeldbacteria bacterium RIFCSPLOWO2_12_FULL_43_9]|nr:MAG: hypothetical protein A3G01_00995 [Candidatus Kerfeldbacteria bacterium RIFCSPLOWO2_12_FULL_43_9]